MRTGRTLTVFRCRRPPPQKKIGAPPEKLEEPPLRKIGDPPGPDPPSRDQTFPPPGPDLSPPHGQTDACENITFAKTSFRPVNIDQG